MSDNEPIRRISLTPEQKERNRRKFQEEVDRGIVKMQRIVDFAESLFFNTRTDEKDRLFLEALSMTQDDPRLCDMANAMHVVFRRGYELGHASPCDLLTTHAVELLEKASAETDPLFEKIMDDAVEKTGSAETYRDFMDVKCPSTALP